MSSDSDRSKRDSLLKTIIFLVCMFIVVGAIAWAARGKPTMGSDRSITEVVAAIRQTANDETGMEFLSTNSKPAKCRWDGKVFHGRAVSVRWREKNRLGALELWERDFFVFNKADVKKFDVQISSNHGIADWILGNRVHDYQSWEERDPDEQKEREKAINQEIQDMRDDIHKRNPPQKIETEIPPVPPPG